MHISESIIDLILFRCPSISGSAPQQLSRKRSFLQPPSIFSMSSMFRVHPIFTYVRIISIPRMWEHMEQLRGLWRALFLPIFRKKRCALGSQLCFYWTFELGRQHLFFVNFSRYCFVLIVRKVLIISLIWMCTYLTVTLNMTQ